MTPPAVDLYGASLPGQQSTVSTMLPGPQMFGLEVVLGIE